MSRNFNLAMAHTFRWEGGLSDDPEDDGGLTRYGITQGTLNRWRLTHKWYPESVRDLTLADARTIYYEWYWNRARCPRLRAPLALALFDAAVNHGPGTASKLMQRAARVKADGIIGPNTVAALKRQPVEIILLEFHSQRMLYYSRHSDFAHFGHGWARRVLDTHHVAMLIKGQDQ